MGPLRTTGEGCKGDLQGRTSPYPLSWSVPPGPNFMNLFLNYCLEENENMGLSYFSKLKRSKMYYHFSIMCHDRVFFSKFLMGGGDSKFSVPVGPRRGRSRMGGGTCEKNPTEAKTAHLMQN